MASAHVERKERTFIPDMEARRHLVDSLSGLEAMTPDIAQQWGAPYGPPEEWNLLVEDREIEGPVGPIPVRVYSPAEESIGRTALVWCHGGAWAFGDMDMPEAHEVARGIAGRANAVVVSVGYHLCPVPEQMRALKSDTSAASSTFEVHFPVPHNDVMAAYRWARDRSGSLGIDKELIAIGGASAGANLAAGAALNLRDEGEEPWQILLSYPIVHPELPLPSEELAEAIASTPSPFLFPPEVLTPFVTNYLGAHIDDIPAYAFPGISDDLSGYPPTFIDNAEFDELRSSGEAFAAQLKTAGVEVEQITTHGVTHGHLNNIGLGPAKDSMDRMAERLRSRRRPKV